MLDDSNRIIQNNTTGDKIRKRRDIILNGNELYPTATLPNDDLICP